MNRPHKDRSDKDIWNEVSERLKTPATYNVEATAFGEKNKTWLTGMSTTSTAMPTTVTTSGTAYVSSGEASWVFEQEWDLGHDGKARKKGPTKVIEGAARPETDMEWLYRRVEEVLWEMPW